MSDITNPRRSEQATTRNPPDITPRTHIIGVCGTSDIINFASPAMDGWFVSDFFLWKSILKDMGASQKWITCLDPNTLIKKYASMYPNGPYIQGNPYEDNRTIVLSPSQLPEAYTNLVQFEDRGTTFLRDEFLKIFRTTCQMAAQNGDSVLLLVAAHGDIEVSEGGLVIGIDPTKFGSIPTYKSEELLTTRLLGDRIKDIPDLKISTFLTSCYSEHWVITPEWSPHAPVVLAAAEKDEESWAWPASTAGRFSGGPFSTYVLQEILREARVIENRTELEALFTTPLPQSPMERTFYEWCDKVTAEMQRSQVGDKDYGSTPVFTREGGHDRFWIRSGYPLGAYYSNWLALSKLPKSQHTKPILDRQRTLDDIPQAEIDEHERFMKSDEAWADPPQNYGEGRTASWSGATGQRLRSKARDLAQEYLASEPGLHNSNANRYLYTYSNALINGTLQDSDLERAEGALSYRLHKMKEAEGILRQMGNTSMCPIAEWVWEDWVGPNLRGVNAGKMDIFKRNLEKVMVWPLCRHPAGVWPGMKWLKPERYLAAAFLLTEKDPDEEYDKLQMKFRAAATSIARRQLANSRSLREVCDGARTFRVKKQSGSPARKRASIQGVFPEAEQ